MTQIDSGVVKELDCVGSLALVRSSRRHSTGLFSLKKKKKKRIEQFYSDLVSSATQPAKRKNWGRHFLPFRAPHRLIKQGKQGLRGVAGDQ